MITIYSTLNDKIIRMEELEYNAMTPEEVRSFGPEWIDEDDVEMRIMRSDDLKSVSIGSPNGWITQDVEHTEPVLVAIGWRRSDKKKRYENSVYLEELQAKESSENDE